MENELRTARLLYREREFELQEKQEEFERRLSELRQRNADMVAGQAALENEASQDRDTHKLQLDQSRHSVELWQKRLRELDASERRLKAELGDIATKQRRLDQKYEQLEKQERERTNERTALRQEYRQRFEEQSLKLRQRSDQLERRWASVQQLHADVSTMYREAIEIRIGTEELWGELSHNESPAALAKRLSELRRRLNDQYELANQRLVDQKEEVATLLGRLQQHESHLSQKRDEVRGWIARRQDEIEVQATKLLERERELDRQSADMRHFERAWREEKQSLEAEIRQLKRLVSPTSVSPARATT